MKNIIALIALFAIPAFAEPIEDNSILLEEAYNQEPGIYQFMFLYQADKSKDWTGYFMNEIPVGGQSHQFSYSIPYKHLDGTDEGGIGDVGVNYRYQLMNEGNVALAPRIGVVLPTGDDKKGLGNGSAHYEFNMAASFKVHPHFVMHMNAGLNFQPKDGTTPASIENSYGLSGIYHFSDTFDFMVETKGVGTDFYVAPGVRTAINSGSWQFVPAVSYSHNVTPYANDYSIYAYLSLEGPI